MYSVYSMHFFIIALITGLVIAIGAGFLSPFLVLNGESLIADGLAHTSFLGFALGIALMDQPIYIAIIVAVISSILIKFITIKLKIHTDSAIGIISAVGLSIGLIVLKFASNFSGSIESMMAGSIMSLGNTELIFAIIVTLLIVGFVLIFYRQLFSIVYDLEYASFSNKKTNLISYILASITAVFIVVGIRAMGILLISAIIIFPALSSSLLKMSFKNTLIGSVIISILAMFISLMISAPLDVPTSALVVLIHLAIMLIVLLIRAIIYRMKVKKDVLQND